MTSSRARLLSSPVGLVLLSLFAATGCNFILNPANSDDVIRCKNTTECEKESFFIEELRKDRTDASCGAPGGQSGFATSKENQVCSLVDKASISCAIDNLPAGDFADAIEAAKKNGEVYTACPSDKKGTLGCPPTNSGTCSNGLKLNEFSTCDDGQGSNPLIAPDISRKFFDVQDQHCRSYFCDDSFVCNTKTTKCTRCDDELGAKGIGVGACGDLALAGARSTVYFSQDKLEMECPDTSKYSDTRFGPVVIAPPLP